MHDIVTLLLAAMAGVALGGIFFGGLWWTVRRATQGRAPGLWFLASLLLRTVIVLAGFYFLGAHHWERLTACLVGFTLARLLVLWLTRCPDRRHALRTAEISHAP